MKGAPLGISSRNGIRVKALIRLLETAHPDAVVVIEAHGWTRAREAQLEVLSIGQGSKPCVILK